MTAQPRSLPLVALVLAAVVLVINVPLVAGGKTWADLRYHTEVAPARMAAADAVWHGTLPAWWEGTGLGVPLAAEPSHGALYPPIWIATSTRTLDLVMILHLLWAAIGIALWARRRHRPRDEDGPSEPAVVVVAVLALASGVFASTALRGALPAIAHLPWIGLAASALVDAQDRRSAIRATVGLALAIGFVGLTGVLAALFDGVVIATAIAARRTTLRSFAIALGAGLAISAVQWVPALLAIGMGAGEVVHGLPPSRFLELVVPGSFGASDPDRSVATLAGDHAWAPSLFVGAALFSLSAVRTPARRVLVVIGIFVALVLVAGRGGWPAWLGAPELHIAALVVVLASNAAHGLDDLLAGKRRAVISLLVGIGCTAIALAAVAMKHGTAEDAIGRALVDGGISLVCLGIALVLAWRTLALPLVYVLVLLSSVSTVPSTAPTIERDVVAVPQAFATAAMKRAGTAPLRVFRPVFMNDGPTTLDEAIATLSGASPSTWGLAAARSEDPARSKLHDRTWLAAAREGGALLDRFGIELAILPETLVVPRKFEPIATRGSWSLVKLPVAPAASVMRGALWSADPANTLDLMYPTGGGTGVLRGTVVLEGRNQASQDDRGPPLPCTIERWDPGAIDVTCSTDVPAYAAVSSTSAPGWTVSVDDRDSAWFTADVLRRAVRIEPGTHRIAWRYQAPGLSIGLLLAGIALLGLLALLIAYRR
ncbi:MAG: hypothetical protein M4D80_37920 [Myxococcota bacterium]|nr:hypothetical protein [Myxococcota bacterium]